MSTDQPVDVDDVSRLSSLDDPLRRRLYDYVCAQHEPVSREQAAAAAEIGRTLAAYHLDKLAGTGLLTTRYQRPAGRGGPGAGRPAKLYSRAEQEFTVSVPPRDYELLARLLVESVEGDPSGAVRDAVGRAAARAGREAAATVRSSPSAAPASSDEVLAAALGACGYQPGSRAGGDIELRNCPFHRVAQQHPAVVCGLNLDLVKGIIDEAGGDLARAVLRPQAGRCCVVVRAA